MIFTIVKKEVLDNLLNQRFAICTVVAVILILGTGLVNSRNFVQKIANVPQPNMLKFAPMPIER